MSNKKNTTEAEPNAGIDTARVLGEVLNEQELPDNHPVYWDYFYVCDGKVVRSDIRGTVLDLKRDLRSMGYDAHKITNCDLAVRSKMLDPS